MVKSKKTANSKTKKTKNDDKAAGQSGLDAGKATKAKKAKHLSSKDIEYFQRVLWEKRMELVGNVDHMREQALRSNDSDSAGEISSMPVHMADIGTDNYEQEFALDLLESERKLLKEIDRALAKIKAGTYGICEVTGEPISRARLEAKPYARYCIEYARKLEEGLVVPPPDDDDDLKIAK